MRQGFLLFWTKKKNADGRVTVGVMGAGEWGGATVWSKSIVSAVRYSQVFADASGKKFLYIAMYGYDTAGTGICIAIEGV